MIEHASELASLALWLIVGLLMLLKVLAAYIWVSSQRHRREVEKGFFDSIDRLELAIKDLAGATRSETIRLWKHANDTRTRLARLEGICVANRIQSRNKKPHGGRHA